jgi:serralysin
VIQSNVNGSGITSFSTLVSHATQSGTDVVIDLGSGNSITLLNYSTSSLVSADVLFY